eukprot:scaffold1353_cov363-Pavlova_lutheri.AAC.12
MQVHFPALPRVCPGWRSSLPSRFRLLAVSGWTEACTGHLLRACHVRLRATSSRSLSAESVTVSADTDRWDGLFFFHRCFTFEAVRTFVFS